MICLVVYCNNLIILTILTILTQILIKYMLK